MSKNRNPEWGSGENGKFQTLVLRRDLMPSGSWWIQPSRQAFMDEAKRQHLRITSVSSPYLAPSDRAPE